MIAYLRGRLTGVMHDQAIIDVGGVGYAVSVPSRFLDEAPSLGAEITLHTVLVHREDAMLLYGFSSIDQRELFSMLTSVSGIGAKIALSLLGAFKTAEIVSAVLINAPKTLAKAPGVGLKTAQRLIIELKEKLSKWRPDLPVSLGGDDLPTDSPATEDAAMALQALGYAPDEVTTALIHVGGGELPAETLIRKALEWLTMVGR
ncbi:MAG: Holliday junction branch migration protein RuvA [Candidatus Sericytochromatia bacterium]|nr:Holliday junction branch migration protein RuvA [Candidatus Sericytochromatia bacterium]